VVCLPNGEADAVIQMCARKADEEPIPLLYRLLDNAASEHLDAAGAPGY
jgi:hypothetical protein